MHSRDQHQLAPNQIYMRAAGRAIERPVPLPALRGTTGSSAAADVPGATNIDMKTPVNVDGNKGSSEIPRDPRGSYKATPPSIGALDVSKPEKAQMQPSKDFSLDLQTLPYTIGVRDSMPDLPFSRECRWLRPSIAGSEPTTEYHFGDDSNSVGESNHRRENALFVGKMISPEKVTGSSLPPFRPGQVEAKDIATSSFLPRSGGNSETYRMQNSGLLDVAVQGAASRRRRTLESAFIICALTVAVLMATLLIVVVLLAVKVEECDRQLQLAREPIVDKACFNAACEMVSGLLKKWQNPNVQPCNAFHRHVCGRWRRIGIDRPSYATENSNNFLIRIGLSLERVANASMTSNSGTKYMALFYYSCRQYIVQQRAISVRDALLMSGIEFHAWLVSNSFQHLFSTIVAECLRTGLTSVISVKFSNQEVYVDIGLTLTSFLPNQTHRLAAVIEAALSELQVPRNPALIPALVDMDSRMHQALAASSPPRKFHSVAVRRLPTESLVAAWLQGLNRGLNKKLTVNSNTLLNARGLTQISGLIGILSSIEVNLASIYSLMLPIAQVMQFGGAFGTFSVGGSTREHSSATDWCLRETAEHFPMELAVWVKKSVETPEARGYFKSMVDALGKAVSKLSINVKGLDFNATDIAKLRTRTKFMPHEAPPRAVPSMKRDNFLLNMIALSGQVREERTNTWLQLSRQQLTGDLAVLDGKNMVIPTLQLAGDVMHAKANDPMLDYSTVGVRVLVEWAHVLLNKNPALSSRLVDVVRNRTSSRVPVERLPNDTLRWLLFLPWALDVALVAARERSPVSPYKVIEVQSRDQLFFRRFCQAGCGDAQGALLCSYATRQSTLFAQAFKCKQEDFDCIC